MLALKFLRSSTIFLIVGILWAFLNANPLYAQNPHEIDSLRSLLPKASSKEKVKILLDLADIFLQANDEKQLMDYLQQARILAEEIDYKKGIGRVQLTEGMLLTKKSKFDQAKATLEKALEIFNEINDQYLKAHTLNNIGNNFLVNGQFVEALPYYKEALIIFTKTSSKKSMAYCLTNIGIVEEQLGNYKEALTHFLKALKIDEELNYEIGIAHDYNSVSVALGKLGKRLKSLKYQQKALAIFEKVNDKGNMAMAYHNIGINYKHLERYDSSRYNLEKALGIFKTIGNKRGTAVALNSLGSLYYKQDNYFKASDYFTQSVALARTMGNERVLIENYLYIAKIFLQEARLDSAVWYANEGLTLAEEAHIKDKISELHLLLSTIYEREHNFPAALHHHRQHLAYHDTLLNEAKTRQLQELEIQYETEKKEQQIVLQQTKLQNKSLLQKMLIGIIFLVLISSVVIFKSLKSKQQAKRRLLNEQLRNEKRETEKAKELDQLKSRFFANIAHEFRTPLTLIMGPMEQLMEPDKESAIRQSAKLAHNNALQLLNLINQLLDLSRLEAGVEQMHFVKRDFIAFLKGITLSFLSLEEQKDISLQFESNEEEIIMAFDGENLEKVFSNLIHNAFKFTKPGGTIAVKVERGELVQKERSEAAVVIAVTDTGMGIEASAIPHIFDRFYRSSRSTDDHVGGTGIGLALAKELVELHRGNISAQSKEQEGTTFTIVLPLQQSAVDTGSAHHSLHSLGKTKRSASYIDTETVEVLSSEETKAENISNKEIVLVVEDNPDVRKFIVQSFQWKYEVLEAQNGKEGIIMAEQHIPDLIVSDVMMPEMDGFETCKLLKLNEKTSHIPIILLTAKAGIDSKLQGLETGADDYLAKPFNTKELLIRSRNLIANRKAIRAKYLQGLEEQTLATSATVQEGISPREQRFLEKAKDAVEEAHANEDFGVEELSEALCMGRKNLHRKLKALTGQSPSHFIRTIRLQKAKQFLQLGSYTVQEVAYQVGFNSATYFSTCFSTQFGYAPSETIVSKKDDARGMQKFVPGDR